MTQDERLRKKDENIKKLKIVLKLIRFYVEVL